MRNPLSKFGLPLFGKELVEQASRRRTYFIRTLYASLLFGGFLMMVVEVMRRSSGIEFLGSGRDIFFTIVGLDCAGICLFLPALMSGAITSEKERDNLPLLLLTKLEPMVILAEKYVSRLLPMVCLLLLSVPALALTYTLGGVSFTQIWAALWMLFLMMLQIGALSLMCSAFFRTTAAAFISTYIIGFIIVMFFPMFEILQITQFHRSRGAVYQFLESIGAMDFLITQTGIINEAMDLHFVHLPPYLFFKMAWSGPGPTYYTTQSLPIALMTLVFLCLSRVCLIKRAFAAPIHPLLTLLRVVDRLFEWMNQNRFTRGKRILGSGTLAGDKPVQWRETQKKSFGSTRYLVRILIIVMLAGFCFFLFLMSLESYAAYDWLHFAIFCSWILSVFVVSSKAASLMACERSHQSLNVILTTPINTSALIREKLTGVYRLMAAVLVPFLSLIVFSAWWRNDLLRMSIDSYSRYYRERWDPMLYVSVSIVTLLIYIPMIAWFSFLVGMFAKTQSRAIMGAIGGIVGWCSIPPLLLAPIAMIVQPAGHSEFNFLLLFSPAVMVPINEFSDLQMFGDKPILAFAINSIIYGGIAIILRVLCTVLAPRLLDRQDRI